MTLQIQISRAAQGDPDACDALARQYLPLVFRYLRKAWRLTSQEAEELTQETFAQLWSSLPGFQGGSFKAWLLTIARRVAWKSTQHTGPTEPYDDTQTLAKTTQEPPDPETMLATKQNIQNLRTLFQALPPEPRELLYMYYLEELSIQEIAQTLSLTYNATKARIKRARQLLRQRWERHHSI